jgi:chromosome segregation ATPase
MESNDTQKILDAVDTKITQAVSELGEMIQSILTRVDTRMDGLDTRMDTFEVRMDGIEERIGALTQEVRTGYQKLDTRLSAVEEEVHAISATLDRQFEGEALGTTISPSLVLSTMDWWK